MGWYLIRLALYVFRITKPVAALAGADSPYFASPVVDILEEVPVKRAIMGKIQLAVRQVFSCARIEHQLLEFIKLVLISDIGLVAQNMGAGVAQRVLDGIVPDHRQPFLKALTISLR
ncbi:hypothetical protein [Ensifer adhaerens]|uniref:hypothetical protein n=1 Tax=Ensifer adhaerens TaxID=106592 RepID=UPI003158A9DC